MLSVNVTVPVAALPAVGFSCAATDGVEAGDVSGAVSDEVRPFSLQAAMSARRATVATACGRAFIWAEVGDQVGER